MRAGKNAIHSNHGLIMAKLTSLTKSDPILAKSYVHIYGYRQSRRKLTKQR